MCQGIITDINMIPALDIDERQRLEKVQEWYGLKVTDYYLSLIDWDDPDDPIRRIVIPDPKEIDFEGKMDPSKESHYTKLPGLQHKYRETALLLCSDECAGLCRFCFRKRLFINENPDTIQDFDGAIEYIREHNEISNALITGGDSLCLSTKKLEEIISKLRDIEHVGIIRLGTKIPAYNPYRIINDPKLPLLIERFSTPSKRIYVMCQFNHPTELTGTALESLEILTNAGAILMNQTPLIRGVNDDPGILSKLSKKLALAGVRPYYVFQCRPTVGNRIFTLPVENGFEIFENAKKDCCGLEKTAKYMISHRTGKIEVTGLTRDSIYFKYAQAAESKNIGRFMAYKRNPEAIWFDDYDDMLFSSQIP